MGHYVVSQCQSWTNWYTSDDINGTSCRVTASVMEWQAHIWWFEWDITSCRSISHGRINARLMILMDIGCVTASVMKWQAHVRWYEWRIMSCHSGKREIKGYRPDDLNCISYRSQHPSWKDGYTSDDLNGISCGVPTSSMESKVHVWWLEWDLMWCPNVKYGIKGTRLVTWMEYHVVSQGQVWNQRYTSGDLNGISCGVPTSSMESKVHVWWLEWDSNITLLSDEIKSRPPRPWPDWLLTAFSMTTCNSLMWTGDLTARVTDKDKDWSECWDVAIDKYVSNN